jgi:hypothetical protein
VRDGRIVTIRAVLLSAALLFLAPIAPEVALWLWPIAPMFIGCCCTETVGCTVCQDDIGPSEFQVVIAGVAEFAVAQCSNTAVCEYGNGTWILPFTTQVASQCLWTYDISPDVNCTLFGGATYWTQIRVAVAFASSNYRVTVSGGTPSWYKDYGATKPACKDFVDEAMDTVGTGFGLCELDFADGVSVEVTAL